MSGISRWLSLWLIILFALVIPVNAQTSSGVILAPPQMDEYPRARTYMDVHDEQGNFVHGLKASDISVFEDGQLVPIIEFQEERPGVQFVIAMSVDEPFTIRNSQGISRYDFLEEALKSWAISRQGSTIDDISVLISAGPEYTHFSDPQELLSTLEIYQLDEQALAPSVDSLFQAVEIASDTSPRPGMERAILFITAPIEEGVAFSLQELISRANQQNIHIFVWLVAPPEATATPAAAQLRELASQTGGQFYAFSGDEPLPSVESYLNHLRSIYRLEYESNITSGGVHQLAVEIQHGDQQLKSPVVEFDVDLQPPDPAFILPSLELLREIPDEKRKFPWSVYSEDELVPTDHNLEILVDFPDGRIRPLDRTTLYVDGVIVDENVEPPFEYFVWDLSSYNISGQHLLQVEAVDDWQLTGSSIETPVQVIVDLPSPNPLSGLVRQWPAMAGLGLILAGAVLLLVLIMSGRIRPRALRVPVGFVRRRPSDQETPIKTGQPEAEAGGRRRSEWVNRLHWPHRRLAPEAAAYLAYYSDTEKAPNLAPIPITADELTFGRDISQATAVLDDASVESLHARLVHEDDGSFRIIDESSVAGTWVNYAQVSREGTVLEHGDLIHIGRVGFRFTEREPRRLLKPVITLDES